MLISSNNLFSDALMSKGKGVVKNILSDLKDQGESASFDSLLKNSAEVEQIPSDTVKNGSEESQKDLDSLFSRVDSGVETGIRLSLPDFMKNKNDTGLNVPDAFVSAETTGGDSTSMAGFSPVDFNEPEVSSEGKNSFAFSFSSEPEKEDDDKTAEGLFSSALLEGAEIQSGKDGQTGYENAETAVQVSQKNLEGIVDKPEMMSSMSSSVKPQFVENASFKSVTSKKAEKPVSGFVFPADEFKIASNMFDGQKYEIVNDERKYPGVTSEETLNSELSTLINDPEVLNLQGMNGVVTDSDKTRTFESSEESGKTESLSSVDSVVSNQVKDHLKDGVPLVESSSFPEATKRNPYAAESEIPTEEVISETVSQIITGFENKLPSKDNFSNHEGTSETAPRITNGSENKLSYVGNSDSHEATLQDKTSEAPVAEVRTGLAGFTDALSSETSRDDTASSFTGGSVENKGEEVDRSPLDDLKEAPLHESLSIMPDSDVLPRTQDSKGELQTIPLQKGPEALSDGVANVVKFINSKGETRAQVIVDPPAIGKVQIEIHATPDGMEANLRVDNVAVRDMIRNQLPLLQDMLAQQGISLSEMNVDVHSGDGSRGQWAEKNSSRRNSVDEGEDEDLEFTARIDLEQGLLVWTA